VRYAQRQVLWAESALQRVRYCGRVPTGSADLIAIKAQGEVAHYAGLQSCGSIWACPVCSAKIRNTRAEEISAGAAAWEQAGNSVYMVTLTAPHDLGMRLAALLPVIADSFRAVIGGGSWQRLKKRTGIVGNIRSVEVTHGQRGWHPHLHVLLFITGDPGAYGLAALVLHFRARWRRAIVAAGYRPPDDLHGVRVDRCESAAEAGAYIAKTQDGSSVGNEMARADLKRGREAHRTPFGILDDFRWTGDLADLALWHEYERATKAHQCITWSKGLKSLLLVSDRDDEEIAAEEVGGEIVALIEVTAWREVTSVPGLPGYLLDQAEHGGIQAVSAVLARYGLHAAPGP
jgi:hypothetical protein